jgi:hypothetical protein
MTHRHPPRSSHIRVFTQNEPLTDTERDRLGDFLESCKGGRAMNVEALDGFFAALIAGPETVMPSEYGREVFGGEMSEACEFVSLDEANEILWLMMRHWNTIAATLRKREVYVPLLQDENGVAHGNNWQDAALQQCEFAVLLLVQSSPQPGQPGHRSILHRGIQSVLGDVRKRSSCSHSFRRDTREFRQPASYKRQLWR